MDTPSNSKTEDRFKQAFAIDEKIKCHKGLLYTRMCRADLLMTLEGSEGPLLEELVPPTILHTDVLLGLPLVQVSFLLNHFIPRRHISRIMYRWLAEKHAKTIVSTDPNLRPELAGSTPEGFAVPPHFLRKDFQEGFPKGSKDTMYWSASDVDIVHVVTDLSVGQREGLAESFLMETEHTAPGYCRLIVLQRSPINAKYLQRKSDSNLYYLTSNLLIDDLAKGVKISDPISRHGPAMTVEPKGQSETHEVDKDVVIALPCSQWPHTVVTHWLDRAQEQTKGSWPSKKLKQQLISDGCLVVATAHHASTKPEVEWRISFSRAERALANTLGDIERQCYILLKVLVKHVLQPITLISSYHLKTLLFWTCEKLPQHTWMDKEEGLARCLLFLLDEMIHYIDAHNLPHYFFTDNNLFSHIHLNFMQEIGKKISWLRSNLPQAIFNFDKQYMFSFSPRLVSLEDIFGPFLEEAKKPCKDIQRAYAARTVTLFFLAKFLLLNANPEDMIDICRELCQIKATVLCETADFMSLVETILRDPQIPIPVEYIVTTYEQLMRRFPSDPNMSWIKSNAAALYHELMLKGGEDHALLSERAYTLYTEAVEHATASAVTWAEYANFLLKQGDITKATAAAEKARHKAAPRDENCFTDKEMLTLPDCLSKDIEMDKTLKVKTKIFASFLLVLCHVSSGIITEAEAILCSLEKYVEDNTTDISAFKLLGYGWISTKHFTKARQAFEKVLTLNPNSQAALDAKHVCDIAMVNSQGKL